LINFREVTLRYLGWCPGIDSAINLIPDKDIPERWITYALVSLAVLVGILGFRSYLMFPHTYHWDIDFHDSEYDDVYGMYVEKKSGDFFGIHTVTMDVIAPQNTTCQIQLHQRSEGELRSLWVYRNGYFFFNQHPNPSFNTTMDLHNSYIFIFYAESVETNIIVDIKYLRQDPFFP